MKDMGLRWVYCCYRSKNPTDSSNTRDERYINHAKGMVIDHPGHGVIAHMLIGYEERTGVGWHQGGSFVERSSIPQRPWPPVHGC